MNKKLLALALAGIAVAAPAAAAPTFTPFTMNLSGTDAGAATYTYDFQAGTYTVSLVKDIYTALSVARTNGVTNAGNFTDYYWYSTDGGVNYTVYNPTNSNARFATADEAFNAFSALPALQLTFATDTSVQFHIGDSLNSLGDNGGGTSLRVTAGAVPEPATWAMMVVGFGTMGFAMRRRPSVSASLNRA